MINQVIDAFLDHHEKHVLCLKGDWGVGKTYSWNNYIENKTFSATKDYSYVSLFGLNSISEIKRSIFFNSRKVGYTNLKDKASGPAKKIAQFAKEFPVLKKMTGSAIEDAIISFGGLNSSIICLDDIERRSIPLLEILGLVDLLKNEYSCKVILLFNENKLDKHDIEILSSYREKVIDVEFEVEANITEVSKRFFEEEDIDLVHEFINTSEIKNIRVLQQASWVYQYFKPFLESLHNELKNEFLKHTLTLSYIHYDSSCELSLEESQNIRFFSLLDDKDEEKKKKRQGITKLGYHKKDFDTYIIEYIKKSYIDQEAFEDAITKQISNIEANEVSIKHREAWGLYNNNFITLPEDLVLGFKSFLDENCEKISINDIKSMTDFLKMLGEKENSAWVDNHIRKHIDSYNIKQLEESLECVSDSELVTSIREKLSHLKSEVKIREIIYRIAKNSGWNDIDMENLDSFSEDEYYDWLSQEKDTDLLSMLRGFSPMLGGIDHQDVVRTSIWNKLKNSLVRISSESPLNAHRVEQFIGRITSQEDG